ncbi:glycosyltransferase [Helicobacter jaachi]|nr:glycosyltransferase [Helicobacter jaachi]
MLHHSQQKAPKVAIIVPFYNVQKYLAQCLDSINSQNLAYF